MNTDTHGCKHAHAHTHSHTITTTTSYSSTCPSHAHSNDGWSQLILTQYGLCVLCSRDRGGEAEESSGHSHGLQWGQGQCCYAHTHCESVSHSQHNCSACLPYVAAFFREGMPHAASGLTSDFIVFKILQWHQTLLGVKILQWHQTSLRVKPLQWHQTLLCVKILQWHQTLLCVKVLQWHQTLLCVKNPAVTSDLIVCKNPAITSDFCCV